MFFKSHVSSKSDEEWVFCMINGSRTSFCFSYDRLKIVFIIDYLLPAQQYDFFISITHIDNINNCFFNKDDVI